MVKKSLLWIFRIALWLLGIAAFALAVSALTIQYWVMPNIGSYKNKIADFASASAQKKVTIGNIKADWDNINPHLSLSHITIFDTENRPALLLKDIDVSLSWLSIAMLEPRLAQLTIHAPELTIRRIASGEIFIAGISLNGESKPELANWLLRQNELMIKDARIVWLDEKRNAPELSLEHLDFEVHTPLWRGVLKNHGFTLSALPSVGSKQPVKLSGSFYGNDISQAEQWRGNIALSLTDADLSAYKPWVDYPINLQSGSGSADIGIEFAHQQLLSVKSKLSIGQLQWQIKPDLPAIALNKLDGNIHWKVLSKPLLTRNSGKDTKKNAEFTLEIDQLNAQANTGLNLVNAKILYTQNSENRQSASLSLASFNLAHIQDYAAQFPMPQPLLEKLTATAPQGTLESVLIDWKAQNAITQSYQVRTKFNHLTMSAHEKIPGFENLSGSLIADQTSGKIVLNTSNATLDLKDILRWPVPITQLDGEINWNIKANQTTIETGKLKLSNPHLSGVLNARYLMDGNKGGLLDLDGKFGNGNAKFALFYYPKMLGETTLHWLDTSILAGRAEDIHLTIKGRLADFPFVDSQNRLDPKLGLFRVSAKVSDALLEYGTGWPVIDKLGIHLLFEGKRMELNAYQGNVLGNQILKSKTTIAKLDADYPMLNISSELAGSVENGVKFVNQSPVLEVTQGFTNDLKTTGTGRLKLDLSIPMQALEAAKYKGLYQITNGSLVSPSVPKVSQINGNLEFTESSLNAKNIKASIFNSPMVFSLNTNKDKSIRIVANGNLNNSALQQTLKEHELGKLSDYVSGKINWRGEVLVQKPRVNISLNSDLAGLTSSLPAPLDKTEKQALNLRVDVKQSPDAEDIFVSLGSKLNARVARSIENNSFHLDGASITINSTLAGNERSEKLKGINISGQLNYLDADAWRYVMQTLSTPSGRGVELPIQKVAMQINVLDVFDRRINQLKISNLSTKDSSKEGIQADIQSREVSGNLQWLNQNNGKLIARLSHLSIPDAVPDSISAIKETSSETGATSTKVFTRLKQDYPALDIVASNFELNKKNFGELELVAYPKNENWTIQKLKLNTPEGNLSAEGQWNNWVRSPNTYLSVNWDIKDLGKTLQRFGHVDTIKDGEGSLTGTLYWPGSPHQFETNQLSGELQFEVRKGQILQVKPGVGRLLGLLSLQSLPRRLTLDFRDLFSQGFAFDKINAKVKIDKGVMHSDNFLMSGPAAEVKIKGETNLQKETQHLFVRVLPRISDSISLAALAGGPLAGAVAFLAQKILKDPLNKIASSEYEIIGTWDNPQEVKSNDSTKQNSNNASPLNQN